MKKVFSLFLFLACFLSVGMLGGCSETDLSGVQSQIDELNATISALEDRLSAAEGNNTELQNKLNQATAKLAALEGKINGETIEYLNEGEKVTFVNNGIKLFDIKVVRGTYDGTSKNVRFHFQSHVSIDDPYAPIQNINGYLYEPNTKTFSELGKQFQPQDQYPDEYRLNFATNLNGTFIVYLFSNTNLFAAYRINFVQI